MQVGLLLTLKQVYAKKRELTKRIQFGISFNQFQLEHVLLICISLHPSDMESTYSIPSENHRCQL